MSEFFENVSKRLFSLDIFQGLGMILLIAEAAGREKSKITLIPSSRFLDFALCLKYLFCRYA